MAAKETVNYKLTCPECGQEGSVQVTENNHMYMTNFDLQVKSVEGDFTAKKHGDKDVAVTCLKCQHQYIY